MLDYIQVHITQGFWVFCTAGRRAGGKCVVRAAYAYDRTQHAIQIQQCGEEGCVLEVRRQARCCLWHGNIAVISGCCRD